MALVRLPDVDERQHHEDEGLQGDDQDVEQPPGGAGEHLAERKQQRAVGTERPGAAEQRDQEEQQFARVHVAEQSHAERHHLGQVLDQVEQEVERPQQGMGAERRREQLVDPAAEALDLDAVIDHQQQHAERHADGAVHVGGGQRSKVVNAEGVQRDPREQVDRDQVDRVHYEDPDEHGDGERRDERAVAVHDRLALFLDHLDDHLDEGLEAARARRGWPPGGAIQDEERQRQAGDREEDGVDVDDREVDDELLLGRRQVRQVMDDVLGGCRSLAARHGVVPLFSARSGR